ncbi:hypothetical protein THAOC_12267 [Thalassiosira oceanica]|uniref:beta-glucosidase n=1 Tax=Thalassiosira oceanica TaxID=159749 RepID=K0SKH9_THAOC|nr:hypothetical protein THAOC_12267 [Thalassiosira oceanica]|eukprot:EJK66773.1 hypothetical protein THAOC_12267 [Thalassiosira oceanica]
MSEERPTETSQLVRKSTDAGIVIVIGNEDDGPSAKPSASAKCPAGTVCIFGALLAAIAGTLMIRYATSGESLAHKDSFVWGSSTSAYQVEGAAGGGGRRASIWDTWCAESADHCNGTSGEVACDHFHRWREDVQLMRELGLTAYRFSISWSRVLPDGKASSINDEGIKFYSDLIDALLESNIEPFVTLYHWDLPQALQDEYGGWSNKTIVSDFGDYARVVFGHFSDRVKFWITVNEAWTTSIHGYEEASNAPGFWGKDLGGSGQPYLVGHHQLLAHARAVEIYRSEGYSMACQRGKGQIGIANSGDFRFPLDPASTNDNVAASRAIEFQLGWFTDPVFLGDYPKSMREILGARLPQFSEAETKLLLGSSDFLGLNHYSSAMASEPRQPLNFGGYWGIQQVQLSDDPSWGSKTEMGWSVVPEGANELLKWIDKRYNHPAIYVTENGMAAHEPGVFLTSSCDFRLPTHTVQIATIQWRTRQDLNTLEDTFGVFSKLDETASISGDTSTGV